MKDATHDPQRILIELDKSDRITPLTVTDKSRVDTTIRAACDLLDLDHPNHYALIRKRNSGTILPHDHLITAYIYQKNERFILTRIGDIVDQ